MYTLLTSILLVTSFNIKLETKLYKWVSEINPKAKAMRHFNVEVVLNFDDKVSELFMSQCDNMFNIIIQWHQLKCEVERQVLDSTQVIKEHQIQPLWSWQRTIKINKLGFKQLLKLLF